MMNKKQDISYNRGIVISHGKSEYLFANHIKSNLHLPIKPYAENNGKTSIQINSLMKVLNNKIFVNKRNFKKVYSNVEEIDGKFQNFFVMPIMDLDDSSDEDIEKYKSGEMFCGHWLSPYIIPIWNDKNFDCVLLELGLINRMPSDREKGKMYRSLFPVNQGATDKEHVEELLSKFSCSSRTNMDIFLKRCLENLSSVH